MKSQQNRIELVTRPGQSQFVLGWMPLVLWALPDASLLEGPRSVPSMVRKISKQQPRKWNTRETARKWSVQKMVQLSCTSLTSCSTSKTKWRPKREGKWLKNDTRFAHLTSMDLSRNLCKGDLGETDFLQPRLSGEVCQIFEAKHSILRAHPRKGEKRWFSEQILWYLRLWSNLPGPWRMKFLLCPENQHSDEPITSLSPGWFLPALPLQCRLILKKMAWHYTQSGF